MEIVYNKLPEKQAAALAEAAENGRGGAIHDAVSKMSFQDTYTALKQIEKVNAQHIKSDDSLPKLTVDLELDDVSKSEKVTLRRSCDAYGPKGEPLYSYTHNFDSIDTSQWSPLSILCPGKN